MVLSSGSLHSHQMTDGRLSYVAAELIPPPMCLQVDDHKGDTAAYPKVVLRLPFVDTDNTYFYNDDYQIRCQGDYNDTGSGKVSCSLPLGCLTCQAADAPLTARHMMSMAPVT